MFKISAIQDKELQKKFAEECGAKFIPDAFAYSMVDNDTGVLMGISQFELFSGVGYIYDLKPRIGYSDFEAMFILGRATMNFIDLCGNHVCKAAIDAGEERLMKSIGFKLSDNEYFADMNGMFDGNCSGHK